jgi:hypothetical protein
MESALDLTRTLCVVGYFRKILNLVGKPYPTSFSVCYNAPLTVLCLQDHNIAIAPHVRRTKWKNTFKLSDPF